MSSVSTHPSYLELDRHCLGLPLDALGAEHLRQCARCRAYVAAYRPSEIWPPWLGDAHAPVPREPRRLYGRARPYAWLGLCAVAALCLVVFWPRQPGYDGLKGSPSVLLHVQHDGVAGLWSGEALAPGDKIRVEVMPDEFDHVSVFSLPPGKPTPISLYAGRIKPSAATLLPKAWELDAAPGPETLVVMFARAAISVEAAKALLRARDPREVWLVRLNVPKRSAR